MKKFKITESQFLKLTINLNETEFANQEIVDRILDKINQEGYDSLSELEKHILKNPNQDITQDYDKDADCLENFIKLLMIWDFIDDKHVKYYDDFIEVYSFKDAPNIKWFNGENYIRFYCVFDNGKNIYMDFEDKGEDRTEVISHLKNVWENSLPDTKFLTDDGMSEMI